MHDSCRCRCFYCWSIYSICDTLPLFTDTKLEITNAMSHAHFTTFIPHCNGLWFYSQCAWYLNPMLLVVMVLWFFDVMICHFVPARTVVQKKNENNCEEIEMSWNRSAYYSIIAFTEILCECVFHFDTSAMRLKHTWNHKTCWINQNMP